MNINVNGVNITLTPEQLAEIDRQLNKKKTPNDIGSYSDAFEVIYGHQTPMPMSSEAQLKLIIRAANYLDNNNKDWEPYFNKGCEENNEVKYIPVFKIVYYKWCLSYIGGQYSLSEGPTWLHFKEKSTAELIANRFIDLYNDYLNT